MPSRAGEWLELESSPSTCWPCFFCCSLRSDWLSGLQADSVGSYCFPLTSTPKSFPLHCSQSILCPTCIYAWNYLQEGPCTWPYWTSWSSQMGNSRLSRFLCRASYPSSVLIAPHSLMLPTDLLRVHSIPFPASPTRMLSSAGPDTKVILKFYSIAWEHEATLTSVKYFFSVSYICRVLWRTFHAF